MLGRLLHRLEQVHHRNEIRHDNRPENLEVLSVSDHAIRHTAIRHHHPGTTLTDAQVREALRGRSNRLAANYLGCSVVLLYARFRHVLAEYGKGRRASSIVRRHKAGRDSDSQSSCNRQP
jgi:hypothetical protein